MEELLGVGDASTLISLESDCEPELETSLSPILDMAFLKWQ